MAIVQQLIHTGVFHRSFPIAHNWEVVYLSDMETIFQQLMKVESESLFVEMIKAAISTGRPMRAIKMIIDQTKTKSERDGLIKVIGEDLLLSIEQWVADVKSIANEKE